MSGKAITELKGQYQGEDVYVIGAGPSAGYIDKQFFNNKRAIGVNDIWRRFPNVDYLVRKEFIAATPSLRVRIPLILSRHHCGISSFPLNQFDGEYYIFDHDNNGITEMNLKVVGTDKIVVSYSTITSAMHIAAYMGAANIVLVGHDCGWLDGQRNVPGYTSPLGGEQHYRKFLPAIEPQTVALRKRLKEVYGCRVYSLNPFINFGLEGHVYERQC